MEFTSLEYSRVFETNLMDYISRVRTFSILLASILVLTNCFGQHIISSKESGFYQDPFSLQLNSTDSSLEIRYTVNGSEPTLKSDLFPKELLVDESLAGDAKLSCIPTTYNPNRIKGYGFHRWRSPDIIRQSAVISAALFSQNSKATETQVFSYFIGNEYAKLSFPVISLCLDPEELFDFERGIYVPGRSFDINNPIWTGNYHVNGKTMERPVHFQFFEKGKLQFQQKVGMRIHGLITAAAPQKGLRLYARKEYGAKFIEHQFFDDLPVNKFKRLILRSPYSCDHTFFTDPFIHSVGAELGLEVMASRPAIVFINGEYWGIHNIRERMDNWYLTSHFPELNKDSVDIVNKRGNANEGTDEAFALLMASVESTCLSDSSSYADFESQVDIANYIDYLIIETYFANRDWGQNNVKFWKPQGSGKWRILLIDCDKVMREPESDVIAVLSKSDCEFAILTRALMENQQFRTRFYSRYQELKNSVLLPKRLWAKLDSFQTLYEPEIVWHEERWGYPRPMSRFENHLNKFRFFTLKRPNYYLEDFQKWFDPYSIKEDEQKVAN